MPKVQRSQEEIIKDFARYVPPGKVEVYRLLGFEFVPERREGCHIWDTGRVGRRF